MNNWEDALPPIVREKLARIGAVTEDDVAKTREMNDLEQIISRFFKGDMDASGLWTEFKKYKNEHKDYLLSETQRRIIDSLSIKLNEKELEKRKEGLIAIETLKDENMVTEVDRIFRIIKELKPRKENEYEQTLKRIRDRFAKKPELRMKKITQGKNTIVVQLSEEEAVKASDEWRQFMVDHEKRYNNDFDALLKQLKNIAT